MVNVSLASLVLMGLSLLVGAFVFALGLALARVVEVEEVPVQEAEPLDPELARRRDIAYRTGLFTLIGLAALTAVEYGVAMGMQGGTLPYLIVIALAKAWLIVQYFMHVSQLWREEGHG